MPLFANTELRKSTIASRVFICAAYWSGMDFRAEKYILKELTMILRVFYRQHIAVTPVAAPIRRSAPTLPFERSRYAALGVALIGRIHKL